MKQRETKAHANVETAVALLPKEKEEIAAFVASTGYDGEITYTVVPDLLGGIRIDVGDWVYDTTLKTKLTELVQTLA